MMYPSSKFSILYRAGDDVDIVLVNNTSFPGSHIPGNLTLIMRDSAGISAKYVIKSSYETNSAWKDIVSYKDKNGNRPKLYFHLRGKIKRSYMSFQQLSRVKLVAIYYNDGVSDMLVPHMGVMEYITAKYGKMRNMLFTME